MNARIFRNFGGLARVSALVAVPWNAIVVAFLYYTLLAALVLGGSSARGPVVAGAYGGPILVWAIAIGIRLVRQATARLVKLPVGLVRAQAAG